MKANPSRNFSVRSAFAGEYQIAMSAYKGLDFSRRCLIFPGQSAAYPGMMKELMSSSRACAERFESADKLAKELGLKPVSAYVQTPEVLSADELIMVRNPALFTLEVALFDHLVQKGLRPAAVTGHSFGEYAALVASGIASFADVFKIVVMRDRFSPAPKSIGVMIAANASAEDINACLQKVPHFVSNINSPKQVVVSVLPADEGSTLSLLKKSRIAARTLTEMTQPYHTTWMENVRAQLGEYVANAKITVSAPKIALISSVGAELYTSGQLDFLSLVTRQVCEPVNFPAQLNRALELGAINFLEVGPGEICGPFVKATLGDGLFKVSPITPFFDQVGKAKSVQAKKIKTEKSRLLGTLSRAIAAVTGYSIDEISVEQNFQEDLGIDSIRKAEIVFKFMESINKESHSPHLLQVNLSQFKRIEDVIEHFDNFVDESSDHSVAVAKFERYVKAWTPTAISDLERLSLEDQLSGRTYFYDLAETARADELLACEPNSTLVFFAENCSDDEALGSSPIQSYEKLLAPWISTFRQIAKLRDRWKAQIALVVSSKSHPYFLGLDGFFKSWLKDDGFIAYKRMEFDALPAVQTVLEALVREEFSDRRFVEVRYTNGLRSTKSWQVEANTPLTGLAKPIVVSLGGSRGIGAAILEKFAQRQTDAKIIILGRSSATEARVATSVSALTHQGAEVTYLQTDVTDTDALAERLRDVVSVHGRIDVLLNGAGVEVSRALQNKSDEEIREEFIGKVSPATTLAQLSKSLPIGHLINYSSVAAEFGNPGQTIYALGNEIQAAVGERFTAQNGVTVTTLVLPPWDNLGMTENQVILNGLKANGVALLPKEAGTQLVVDEILAQKGSRVAFLDSVDVRAYDCSLTDARAYQGLFSRPISTGPGLKVPSLNRRDAHYLNDHVINGTVVYPGSSALALAFYVGYHYFKAPPIVENFEVFSFLAPEADVSNCEVRLQKKNTNGLSLQILSRNVVHFACDLLPSGKKPKSPSLPDFKTENSIECEPLYENEHVTLGPKFRLAHELWFNERKELLQVSHEAKLERYTNSLLFDRLQQWFESALQVMGCQLLWQTKKFWIPKRIKRVVPYFENALTEKLFYRTSIHAINDGTGTASSYAQNERGEILFVIEEAQDIEAGVDHRDQNFRLKQPTNERLMEGPAGV